MNPRELKYRELGRQHGYDQRTGATAAAAYIRKSLGQALHLPEDEAIRRVVADYERRLDALPPLAEYPELKGMRECVVAYNGGVAAGAGVAHTDVVLRANYLHAITGALRASDSAAQSPAEPGCTLVYFPHSDHGALLANNQDGPAASAHRQQPPWIVANRAGIIIGTVSSGLFDDEMSPQQFPAPVFLMVYELCGTTAQALDLMTRLNLFWGPCNTLVADRRGDSAIIEKSTCRFGLRRSTDGFSATTEMAAEESAYKAYLWQTRERSLAHRGLDRTSPDWAYWKTCERRSARLLGLLEQARSNPSLEKIEQIIYDHTGLAEQVHMDGMKCHPDQEAVEWSLVTTIWCLDRMAAQYSFADPPTSSRLTARQWKMYDPVDFVF